MGICRKRRIAALEMMASLLLVHFLLMKRGQDNGPILIPVLSDNQGNVYSLLD